MTISDTLKLWLRRAAGRCPRCTQKVTRFVRGVTSDVKEPHICLGCGWWLEFRRDGRRLEHWPRRLVLISPHMERV